MMDCTDRHDRFFLRLMSKNVMLYSEMVATKSAIHGDRKRILSYSPEEKPLALQVGGSDKKELSEVAKIAEDMGYDEININLGCPSKKVQNNKFGACLMKEPDLVSECINEMINSCKIPVTAKTRIGYDDIENFEHLNNFINKMKVAGCKTFILHARKANLPDATACLKDSAIRIEFFALAIALLTRTASHPISIATTASELVPIPASTIIGTFEFLIIKDKLILFRIPSPDPIGEARGIIAEAPKYSSSLAINGSSEQ